MDLGISERVALVGGGSKGLGRAVAEALSAEGAAVAIIARNADQAQKTAEEIAKQTGHKVIAVEADLATVEGVENAVGQTRDQLGEIDILLTNTGGPRPGTFPALQDSDWATAHDLLLMSTVRLFRAVLPGMQKRKWGRIVGITSVSVKEPIDILLLSNVYRAGVTALYKSVAREVIADGVTLNTLLPGLTDTERLKQLYQMQAGAQQKSVEDVLADVESGLPMKKLNSPNDLGRLAAYLCSDLAGGITGTAIPVDGGQLKGLM